MRAIDWHAMSRTQTVKIEEYVPDSVSAPVAGGLVGTLLALLHLFGLQIGGLVGVVLFAVVWPAVGGALATEIESRRGGDASVAGVLAGAYGALVLTVLVMLAGIAGLWSPHVYTTFGVSLWPVVFAVLVVSTISWTVFGYASGWAVRQYAGG